MGNIEVQIDFGKCFQRVFHLSAWFLCTFLMVQHLSQMMLAKPSVKLEEISALTGNFVDTVQSQLEIIHISDLGEDAFYYVLIFEGNNIYFLLFRIGFACNWQM